MPVRLSAQVLVQQVAVLVGNEPLLLRVKVVFVGAGGRRGVEEGAQVAVGLDEEVAAVRGHLQPVETAELNVDLADLLVLGQLEEAVTQTDELEQRGLLEHLLADDYAAFTRRYISHSCAFGKLRSRLLFWMIAKKTCRVRAFITNNLY